MTRRKWLKAAFQDLHGASQGNKVQSPVKWLVVVSANRTSQVIIAPYPTWRFPKRIRTQLLTCSVYSRSGESPKVDDSHVKLTLNACFSHVGVRQTWMTPARWGRVGD